MGELRSVLKALAILSGTAVAIVIWPLRPSSECGGEPLSDCASTIPTTMSPPEEERRDDGFRLRLERSGFRMTFTNESKRPVLLCTHRFALYVGPVESSQDVLQREPIDPAMIQPGDWRVVPPGKKHSMETGYRANPGFVGTVDLYAALLTPRPQEAMPPERLRRVALLPTRVRSENTLRISR
ncbi:hypothetical protein EON79_05800 [bacterium]|nr:MAG: hypothetical protein EON79_05800 [bacterium]